jgi:flagellar basal body-associated protein FliL
MHDHLMGPLLGNIIIIVVAGAITVACFLAMLWMLIRPGETDQHHAKNAILRDDR